MERNMAFISVIVVIFFTVLALTVGNNGHGQAFKATAIAGAACQLFGGSCHTDCSQIVGPDTYSAAQPITEGDCTVSITKSGLRPTVVPTGNAALAVDVCCAACGDNLIANQNGISIESCDTNMINGGPPTFGGKTCASYGFNSGALLCNTQCQIDTSGCYNACIPTTEVCDGQDNDCDSQVDEGSVCCGNDEKDPDSAEQCDGTDFGGMTCADYGFNAGQLLCKLNCEIDSSSCMNAACHDGTINGDEQCEGENFNGNTCADFPCTDGFGNPVYCNRGTLTCSECQIDSSGCAYQMCGNNKREGTEECDTNDLNSKTCNSWLSCIGGTLACYPDCTFDRRLCGEPEAGLACYDGADNDCDDKIDCADSDCKNNAMCLQYPRFICGYDEGNDGTCEGMYQVMEPVYPQAATVDFKYLGKYIRDIDPTGLCSNGWLTYELQLDMWDSEHKECGRCFGSGRDNSPGGLGSVNPAWNDVNSATADKIRTYFAKGIRYNWYDENNNANGCEHSCDPLHECHDIGGCSEDVDGGGYKIKSINLMSLEYWTGIWGGLPTDFFTDPTVRPLVAKAPWTSGIQHLSKCYDAPAGSPVFSKTSSPLFYKDVVLIP